MSTKTKRGFAAMLGGQNVVTPYIYAAIAAVKKRNKEDSYSIHVDLERRQDWEFHPSTHTQTDVRKLYFLCNPETHKYVEKPDFGYESSMSMAVGTAVHTIVQSHLVNMGYISKEDVEVEVEDKERRIYGHMDFYIPDPSDPKGKAPVDFKTASPVAFKNLFGPRKSYLQQINVYMDVLGHDHGYIVIMEQSYPYRLKEFRIERDQSILDEVYGRWEEARKAIIDQEPPKKRCEKTVSGQTIQCQLDSAMMKECPVRSICRQTFESTE